MAGQSGEKQCLETELTKMLQDVKPIEEYHLYMPCIFRVPPKIRETNPKAYTPRIVSIGPYHHKARHVDKEDNSFESMEELKLKYFKRFLIRTQLSMTEIVVKIKGLEEEIRLCYADPIKYDSDEFLKIIVLDACFIIELFLRFNCIDWMGNDPLFVKDWMQEYIKEDLLLLENQLPFFVLERLYNLTGKNDKLLDITFKYFEGKHLGKVCPWESPKHFTDFLRSSIISSSNSDLGKRKENEETKQVYSASQLMDAGLKFKFSPDGGLLDLTYSKGVLTMSVLNIYDGTEMLFRNIMAYEQCQGTQIITQYAIILDFLINTEKDVDVLVDKKIIVNWTGDANKVVTMVNNLSSHLFLPSFHPYYFSLCNSLNAFYENRWNKFKAIFIHEYFNTPWTKASTITAVVIVLLTFIQTVCSIISVFRGN